MEITSSKLELCVHFQAIQVIPFLERNPSYEEVKLQNINGYTNFKTKVILIKKINQS